MESISNKIFNFDLLSKELGLKVTNIGLECEFCHRRFGIKIYPDQNHNLNQIHPKRFLCECRTKEE